MLTQLRNIHIHTTGIEVVIINPDSLQSKVTLQNFISVCTKQSEKFRFFGSQLRLLAFCSQNLFLSIESKLTDLVDIAFFVLLSTNTSQDSFNSESQLFHTEWFRDIIIRTNLKSFQDIFFQRFCSQEDDRYLSIRSTDILCQRKAILFRHHNVKHAQVIFILQESLITGFSIRI